MGADLLLVTYSRTGTTATAAGWAAAALREAGLGVESFRVEPLLDLPYPLWLALSFFPGARFPVRGSPAWEPSYRGCLLAMPKWTFACPPVNAFLARSAGRLPPTGVLVTCGGWDQDRYLRALLRRLGRSGIRTLGGLAVRRRDVESGAARARVEAFALSCFDPREPPLSARAGENDHEPL